MNIFSIKKIYHFKNKNQKVYFYVHLIKMIQAVWI